MIGEDGMEWEVKRSSYHKLKPIDGVKRWWRRAESCRASFLSAGNSWGVHLEGPSRTVKAATILHVTVVTVHH
jgi:hypothetical protein